MQHAGERIGDVLAADLLAEAAQLALALHALELVGEDPAQDGHVLEVGLVEAVGLVEIALRLPTRLPSLISSGTPQ